MFNKFEKLQVTGLILKSQQFFLNEIEAKLKLKKKTEIIDQANEATGSANDSDDT